MQWLLKRHGLQSFLLLNLLFLRVPMATEGAGAEKEDGEIVDEFSSVLASFESDASKSPYEFDSFSGLYFDNVNDVFYDPQTSVHFNPDTGACYIWNASSSSWDDFTVQYGAYYNEIWKSSWGGYFEQLQMNQLKESEEVLKKAKKEWTEVPSMIRLVPIDHLTLKDIPGVKSYDIGKFAESSNPDNDSGKSNSNKKLKLNEKESAHKKTFTIGRGTSNFISIPDEEVSTNHAEIVWEHAYFVHSFVLRDLGSVNGTFLNEERLNEAREVTVDPIPLEDGDIVRFGAEATYRIEYVDDYDTEAQFYSELNAINNAVEERRRREEQLERERLEAINLALLKVDPKSANKKFRKELLGSEHQPRASTGPIASSTASSMANKIAMNNSKPKAKSDVFGVDEKEDFNRLLNMSTSAGIIPKIIGTAPERPIGGSLDDVNKPIPESNIGHKLLMKMGWKFGQAVGARQEGIVEPVKASGNKGTRGLGFRY